LFRSDSCSSLTHRTTAVAAEFSVALLFRSSVPVRRSPRSCAHRIRPQFVEGPCDEGGAHTRRRSLRSIRSILARCSVGRIGHCTVDKFPRSPTRQMNYLPFLVVRSGFVGSSSFFLFRGSGCHRHRRSSSSIRVPIQLATMCIKLRRCCVLRSSSAHAHSGGQRSIFILGGWYAGC